MTQKIKVKTGTIEETLLLPLWGRAYETQKKHPRLIDEKAVAHSGYLFAKSDIFSFCNIGYVVSN